jgi:hypothetical protein
MLLAYCKSYDKRNGTYFELGIMGYGSLAIFPRYSDLPDPKVVFCHWCRISVPAIWWSPVSLCTQSI